MTWGRAAAGCGVLSLGLLVLVAAAGDSAAGPGLGPLAWHPPWDAGLGWSSATVSVLLVLACLLAVAATGLGLLAVVRGAAPAPRLVAVAAVAVVGVLVLVPPIGSADHLSYAAYGRIAAAGDNPYLQPPIGWRGGTDPVAGAVQPPWQGEPSVYGPVATAVQAVAAVLGAGSLRLTVWLLQLVAGAAFLAAAWTLDRLTRSDPRRRARAAVLWTLNPLLLAQLVLGAHVDVLAAAAALGAFALATPSPLLAGALLGVAAGTKLPYVLAGLAACWGIRVLPAGARSGSVWRHVGLGLAGALLVLLPVHLWAGPDAYRQLGRAGRMVSFATPWRLLVDQLDPVYGVPEVRRVVGPVALALAVLLAVLLARAMPAPPQPAQLPQPAPAAVATESARAMLLLGLAWVLTVPYALPWYDAMVWAPLAMLAPSLLDGALLARLGVLALAYVPGRVVQLSADVERLSLGFRRYVAPWLLLAALLAVLGWAAGRWRSRPAAARRRPAPAP